MALSDLASLGSFISGVAVLVSLIYLSLQVRQATKHARAVIGQNRVTRMVDMTLRGAEPGLGELIQRGRNGDETLTPPEISRFMFWARAHFFQAEDDFVQHRDGMLADTYFKGMDGRNVRIMRGAAGMQAAWEILRESFEPGFVAYMDNVAKRSEEFSYSSIGNTSIPEGWPRLVARYKAEQSARAASSARDGG